MLYCTHICRDLEVRFVRLGGRQEMCFVYTGGIRLFGRCLGFGIMRPGVLVLFSFPCIVSSGGLISHIVHAWMSL